MINAQKGAKRNKNKNKNKSKNNSLAELDETTAMIKDLGDYDGEDLLRLQDHLGTLDEQEKGSVIQDLLADGMRSTSTRRDMLKALLTKHFYFHYVNYGCYCIDSKWSKGEPVDNIDKSCKAHKKCFECNKLDFIKEDGSSSCDPAKQQYTFNVTSFEDGTRKIYCLNELGTCRRAVCECDRQLSEDIARQEDSYQDQYREKFDHDGICKHTDMGNGVPRLDACCGDYPKRFPFSVSEGSKQCCKSDGVEDRNGMVSLFRSKTYNPFIKQCCNGKVKAIGSC